MSAANHGAVLREVEDDLAAQLAKCHLRGKHVPDTKNMPAEAREAIVKLAQLQVKHLELENELEKEWLALKAKYDAKKRELYDERRKILTQSLKQGDKATVVPNFWWHALKNSVAFEEMIEEHDNPILSYLRDISWSWVKDEEPLNFTITFEFAENPYFENKFLTKTYLMDMHEPPLPIRIDSDLKLPKMAPAEPYLKASKGTEIVWKEGKDVTKRTVVRKQKNKRTFETRTVTKIEEQPSFFNFFKSYTVPTDPQLQVMHDRDKEEIDAILEIDYDCGVTAKEKLIPEAVRYFLAEVLDDEEEESDSDVCDDDDEDDDDDDDDNSHPMASGLGNRRPMMH